MWWKTPVTDVTPVLLFDDGITYVRPVLDWWQETTLLYCIHHHYYLGNYASILVLSHLCIIVPLLSVPSGNLFGDLYSVAFDLPIIDGDVAFGG